MLNGAAAVSCGRASHLGDDCSRATEHLASFPIFLYKSLEWSCLTLSNKASVQNAASILSMSVERGRRKSFKGRRQRRSLLRRANGDLSWLQLITSSACVWRSNPLLLNGCGALIWTKSGIRVTRLLGPKPWVCVPSWTSCCILTRTITPQKNCTGYFRSKK